MVSFTETPGTDRVECGEDNKVSVPVTPGHVYRYIAKPWDPDELQAVLRQAGELYDLLAERRRLQADLQARNRELQEANAELRRADALKEAFIRVASHELRTPLTILLALS